MDPRNPLSNTFQRGERLHSIDSSGVGDQPRHWLAVTRDHDLLALFHSGQEHPELVPAFKRSDFHKASG